MKPWMGTVGDCYDNAMAESFWATLEREVLSRRRFKTQAQAKTAIFTWIERWYNPHCRHSSLAYRSPMNYEHPRPYPRAAARATRDARIHHAQSRKHNPGVMDFRRTWGITDVCFDRAQQRKTPQSICRLWRQNALWYTVNRNHRTERAVGNCPLERGRSNLTKNALQCWVDQQIFPLTKERLLC